MPTSPVSSGLRLLIPSLVHATADLAVQAPEGTDTATTRTTQRTALYPYLCWATRERTIMPLAYFLFNLLPLLLRLLWITHICYTQNSSGTSLPPSLSSSWHRTAFPPNVHYWESAVRNERRRTYPQPSLLHSLLNITRVKMRWYTTSSTATSTTVLRSTNTQDRGDTG